MEECVYGSNKAQLHISNNVDHAMPKGRIPLKGGAAEYLLARTLALFERIETLIAVAAAYIVTLSLQQARISAVLSI